ncbi:MAG: MarR family winged helix-turn-helix transcriptional regulator [Acidimicrobiales bacterium]
MSTPRPDEDPIGLVGLLFEAATSLRRIAGAQLEQDHGLPRQSFDVLVRLARSPGRQSRMSDLAAQTALTPSGLTRAVDRLEQAGLVCREACPDDGRGSFASLTPAGSERMDHVLDCHRAHLESVLTGVLDGGERELLVVLLGRLRDQVNPVAGARRLSSRPCSRED